MEDLRLRLLYLRKDVINFRESYFDVLANILDREPYIVYQLNPKAELPVDLVFGGNSQPADADRLVDPALEDYSLFSELLVGDFCEGEALLVTDRHKFLPLSLLLTVQLQAKRVPTELLPSDRHTQFTLKKLIPHRCPCLGVRLLVVQAGLVPKDLHRHPRGAEPRAFRPLCTLFSLLSALFGGTFWAELILPALDLDHYKRLIILQALLDLTATERQADGVCACFPYGGVVGGVLEEGLFGRLVEGSPP